MRAWTIAVALPVVAASLAAAQSPSAGAGPPLPARPATYATDRTGRLDAARMAALNERLAAFERETSTQVLVYVDARLPAGMTLEDFAARTFEAWAVGQKGRDNGVVFLAFLDDRVMRYEVGYGLEGALPDLRAQQALDEVVRPLFRSGDLTGGVEAAAEQAMAAARGEPYQGSGRTVAEAAGLFTGLSWWPSASWPSPRWPFALAGAVAVLLTTFAGLRLRRVREEAPWLLAAAIGLSVAALSLVVSGGATTDPRPLAAAGYTFVAGLATLGGRRWVRSWRASVKAVPRARWAQRVGLLCWLALPALLLAWIFGRARSGRRWSPSSWRWRRWRCAAPSRRAGKVRVRRVVGPLAYMVAAAVAPSLYAATLAAAGTCGSSSTCSRSRCWWA